MLDKGGRSLKRCRGRGASAWSIGGLALLLALSLLAPASAFAAKAHVFSSAFGSAGSGDGQLELAEHSGLAVNETSHDIYVADTGNRRIDQFSAAGTFIRAFGADVGGPGVNICTSSCVAGTSGSAPGAFEIPTFIAIDNSGDTSDGDVYVADTANNLVTKFEADGTLVSGWGTGGQLDGSTAPGGPFGELAGIAVDTAGTLDVLRLPEPHVLFEFDEAGVFSAEIETPRGNGPAGLGVDPSGNFFKVNGFPSVEKFESSGAVVGQVTNSLTTTGLGVDPSNGDLYVDNGGAIDRYAFNGSGEVIEPGGSCALLPEGEVGCNPTDSFGLGHLTSAAGLAVDSEHTVYAADAGSSQVAVFEEVTLPDATTEGASVLNNGTVTFLGAVSAAGGAPATCVFQYVETSAEGFEGASSVPCSPAGPFTGTGANSVSAEVSGLAEGSYRFRLLATNEEGSTDGGELLFTFETVPGLPDGRAYEMVSPPRKRGEVVPPEPAAQLGGSCGDCSPGQNTQVMPMQSAPDGESVLYLGQPFFEGLASAPSDYLASRGTHEWGTEGLSSAATTGQYEGFSADLSRGVLFQEDPALSPEAPTREGKAFSNLYLQQGGVRRPLVTEEPPNRDPHGGGIDEFRIRFAAADLTFEHLIFEANDALTKEVPGIAPSAPEVEASANACSLPGAKCNLYEWVGGQLELINVLPSNAAAASSAVIGAGRLLNQFQSPDVGHAISDDASRIFWTGEETGQVYVRIDGEETVEVPGPGTCKESVEEAERVCFLTASADGSRVLLSDGEMFELNEEENEYEPSADLTLDGSEVHQGGFKGILGAAEDLSRVYFVDTKVLTEGEENANQEHAEDGNFNLYAWDEGEPSFIGALLAGDGAFGTNGRFGAWTPSPSHRTAQVSPDGRFLAFMSLAELTDFHNVLSGGGICLKSDTPACREVFEYSADAGSLSCASCNPTDQQPLGGSNLSLVEPNGGEAAPFPQLSNLSPEGGGRLFFESRDALSPGDTNGKIQDVYEWEPTGVGSCGRANGCVYLISSGHSPNDSMFLDSSANGNDAFFITRELLLQRDKDQQLDLYDARVGGGLPEQEEASCGGEGCAGPASNPPPQLTPGSAGVVGPGNPPKHKHKHKHKHKKKQHKHHKGKHHKRAAKRTQGGSK